MNRIAAAAVVLAIAGCIGANPNFLVIKVPYGEEEVTGDACYPYALWRFSGTHQPIPRGLEAPDFRRRIDVPFASPPAQPH